VGIEVSQGSVLRAARRVLLGGIDNVAILYGDARFLLDAAFEEGAADRIVMNFPCPWPKRRHARKRVTRGDFCARMARVLKTGGLFELTTDEEPVALEAREGLASTGAFGEARIERNPDVDWTTKYGRRWREMGKDLFFLRAERFPGGTPSAGYRREGECALEVESAGSGGAKKLQELLLPLLDGERRRDGACWVFRDLMAGDDGIVLIRTIAVDDDYEQHFFVKVAPSPRGFLVQPDSVGCPFRTPAVRGALGEVASSVGGIRVG
jgi:tRNA (guanine-N7-)-methyltransferase